LKNKIYKNVQVIDGALNCTYDVYAVVDRDFNLIFPGKGQDIKFVEGFFARNKRVAQRIWKGMWSKRVDKKTMLGIHGTIFCGLEFKKAYYPTKRDSEMTTGLAPVPKSAKKETG
jgi:hypothetical protein